MTPFLKEARPDSICASSRTASVFIANASVIPIQYLSMCAGFAISAGMPYEDAWRAITVNPATTVGIGDRGGSLEVGKDGDVVIWDSDPLRTIGAEALITVIEGKIVYKAE